MGRSKIPRKKVTRAKIEARLLKNEHRIQAIGENSYLLRQVLEQMDAESNKTQSTETPVENKGEANVG